MNSWWLWITLFIRVYHNFMLHMGSWGRFLENDDFILRLYESGVFGSGVYWGKPKVFFTYSWKGLRKTKYIYVRRSEDTRVKLQELRKDTDRLMEKITKFLEIVRRLISWWIWIPLFIRDYGTDFEKRRFYSATLWDWSFESGVP